MPANNNSWLRDRRDKVIALERLAHHPVLTPTPENQRHLIIRAGDTEVASLLKTAALVSPVPVGNILDVIAENRCHRECPHWFGYQKTDSIFLFFPAYRNVTTLFFTFFHELGHWYHKGDEFLNDTDWENFLRVRDSTVNVENETEVLNRLEDFANEFAWFCSYPEFLRIERPNSYNFFACLLAGKADELQMKEFPARLMA